MLALSGTPSSTAEAQSPAVLYNLARSEQLTGHELEALEHFRLFLRVGATDVKITDAMRDKAKQNVADLSRKVGQVEIEVPSTARVTVDGKPLDETPKDPVPVQPGRHTIEATFDGKVRNVSVECVAGNVVKARIDFDTPGTEPPADERHRGGWSTGRIVTVSALSAGAIAGGVLFFVFHGKAQSNVDDAKALLNGGSCVGVMNPVCAQASSLKDDRDSNVTLSTVARSGWSARCRRDYGCRALARSVEGIRSHHPNCRARLRRRELRRTSEENGNASMDHWDERGRVHHGTRAGLWRGDGL